MTPHTAEAVFDKLFLTAEGRANPYPLYDQLRETEPVYRSKHGMWLLTRYDDCWAAMRDPRFGKDYAPMVEQRFGPDWRRHLSLTAGEHSMLNTTGPEHTRLRKLVSKSFTPRMIEALKPTIESTVTALLDPIAEAGGGNVLEAVGLPLPVTIVGAMLGVPEADRPQLRGLVRDLVAIFEMQPTEAQLADADAAQLAITFQNLLGCFDLIELRGEAKFQDRLILRGLTALNVACRATTGRQATARLPDVATPSATRPASVPTADRGLRPGGADADLRWRADLRERIESHPTRADSIQARTGERLAATVALLA